MRKMLAIGFLAIFCLANTTVLARTKYTPTAQIINSDTIRGRKTAAYQAKSEQRARAQAAAAAKINYEEMAKAFNAAAKASEANKGK